jgi:FAD/FMN-containing dehydrogenase
MKVSGWGRFPVIDAEVIRPREVGDLLKSLGSVPSGPGASRPLIPYGLGRSYGDSALADVVMSCRSLDHFHAFDDASGELTCSAGVSLAEVLQSFVPRGWFLPVTPGTKFVTVGGAIASDVHGKNHHRHGCFSDHVTRMAVATASDGIVECSPTQNVELFRATCGGMGLTGVIVDATFRLIPVTSSLIRTTTLRATDLGHALELFAEHDQATYSMAWIDCLASGSSLGRSLVMLGEHHDQPSRLKPSGDPPLNIPLVTPGALLNRYSMRLFNSAYYGLKGSRAGEHLVHYEPFFYPLDAVRNWNRLYGRTGLTQYQFVLPVEAGRAGMAAVLSRIVDSQRGSFLAVLKAFGPGNGKPLSFPTAGWTLALDFKCDPPVLDLLDELDRIVLDHGGRFYLSKDARMTATTFAAGYPLLDDFAATRRRYGADQVFNSRQSQRLGI